MTTFMPNYEVNGGIFLFLDRDRLGALLAGESRLETACQCLIKDVVDQISAWLLPPLAIIFHSLTHTVYTPQMTMLVAAHKSEDPLDIVLRPPPDETPAQRALRLEREEAARRVSAAIDESIKAERQLRKKRRIVRLLLLGQSESGT